MSEVYIRLHLVIIFLITNLISVQLGFMMPPSPRAYCLAPRSEIVENERARLHISEEFIAQLSPIDVQLLEQIISGGVAKQSQLFKRHRHKVYRLVDEEIAVKPEGRTIYLDLERPIQIGERAIRVLRIKGVRPSTDDKGEAQVYLGWGRAPMKLIADENGKITFVPSPYEPQPLGGAFLSFAQLEFQIAEENIKTKASWKVDYPIGWGEYEDKTFQGERLGFVIFGMGEADTRLTLLPVDTVTQDNVWFLFTRRYKNSHNERLLRPERMYQAIGRAIRAYHESGYFHGALHLGNIGVEKGGEEIFIRDLEDTVKRNSSSGTPPPSRVIEGAL